MEDVVIVGAGPVGLMLASELSLAGVTARILEKLPAPTGLSKALGIQGSGVDLLALRGLLPRFQAEAALFTGSPHFAGIPLDGQAIGGTKFLFILQSRTEAFLEAYVRERGVPIQRGQEVSALSQDPDCVSVTLTSGETLRARYVVGCDGASSTVRGLAGIEFPGTEPTLLLRLGDVKLEVESIGPGQVILKGGVPAPFGFGVPLDNGYFRIITHEPYPEGFDRQAPMTLEELTGSIRRSLGLDTPVHSPRWLSRFTDASRLASTYKSGRIFLAGDAAHMHLPAGGPGIATGFHDAANLGWKLAQVLAGRAPATLLDSYHTERHPAAARVLLHTRAQAAVLGKSDNVAALRQLLAEIFRGEQALRLVTNLIRGGDSRYPMTDDHPLSGYWFPDWTVAGQGLADRLRDSRGLLVTARPFHDDRVESICGPLVGGSAQSLLIRPDGYVAWARDDDRFDGLGAALNQWF